MTADGWYTTQSLDAPKSNLTGDPSLHLQQPGSGSGAGRSGNSAGQKSKASYEIGYGKPPKHTRFKKGQSGNPKGRMPLHARSISKSQIDRDVLVVMQAEVTTKLGGKRVRIPAVTALFCAMIEKALSGDVRAMKLVMKSYLSSLSRPPGRRLGNVQDAELDGKGSDAELTRGHASPSRGTQQAAQEDPHTKHSGIETFLVSAAMCTAIVGSIAFIDTPSASQLRAQQCSLLATMPFDAKGTAADISNFSNCEDISIRTRCSLQSPSHSCLLSDFVFQLCAFETNERLRLQPVASLCSADLRSVFWMGEFRESDGGVPCYSWRDSLFRKQGIGLRLQAMSGV